MKQIMLIAEKEFKTAFRDRVFLVITGLFIALSIISVYIGSSTKNAEMQAYNDIITLLKAQGATSFPPSPEIFPLAILRNIVTYISVIGSALAIFLGFDAFSGERENGTLKLILVRPVYRDQFVTGKLLGAAFVLGLLLGITLLFNMALFFAVSGVAPGAVDLGKLAMFFAVGFLYLMVFYIITLFVSSKTADRTFGFILLMVLWVLVSFVIPQIADTQRNFAYAFNATSQTVVQIPSDTEVSKTIEVFSPAVQFQNIGKNLLQEVSETAGQSVGTVLAGQILPLIYMCVPGILLLFLTYRAAQKENAS